MLRFDDRTVLVLGLGETGLAVARWVAALGGRVRVADTRAEPPMGAALRAQVPDAQFVAGEFAPILLDGAQLLVLSPGLSPTHSSARGVVEAARRRGIEVAGEIELFARALAELARTRAYRPRLIGVTGTNGKTTTARLAGLLVARAGRSVAVAGNVSPTALDSLREALARNALPQVWVLELSSFQLATTESLACDAAAVLNLSQDHLDWHGTMDEYARAKARIFARATVQVVNRDDPRVVALARRGAPVVTFGADLPAQPDAYGLLRDGGLTWLACAEDAGDGQRRRRAAAELAGVDAPVHVHRLMPADALRIRGRHNALNALAALALGRAIGAPLAPMLHALREYRGEPHRTEHVLTIDGVDYIDDSKGTNVGATVAALEGLGSQRDTGRLLVILGGDGKGQDFSPLAAPLRAHARAVALIGRDGPAIARLIGADGPEHAGFAALPDAVRWCAQRAQPGDAVLLSPACASFDMFRDYRHRAEVFVAAVQALAEKRGVVC